MIGPDDFGMDWLRTLAHTAQTERIACHGSFWQEWARRFEGHRATLEHLRASDDPSDPTATHAFLGAGHASIGCRLESPSRPRGAVVVLHGYSDPPTLAESVERRMPMVDRGLAVLAMRIRGYPGSRAGVGDLTAQPYGWICQGLRPVGDRPDPAGEWVLGEAVADVLYAVAALRRSLPGVGTVAVLGQSFGGGLATIAAAQSSVLSAGDPAVRIDRLVLGVPTFGDWPWRLAHTHLRSPGSGGELRRYIAAHAMPDDGFRRTLSLFDAASHARLVRQPTICKLALRDDVVPAPTQAAVYNALGTDPGLKARFVTPFGHFDGGLADARRHALFDRFATDFLDPAADPAETIDRWSGLLLTGDRPPEAAR
ncbi:MAG: acetylxylan esterase [Phycisphaerales bacterium]